MYVRPSTSPFKKDLHRISTPIAISFLYKDAGPSAIPQALSSISSLFSSPPSRIPIHYQTGRHPVNQAADLTPHSVYGNLALPRATIAIPVQVLVVGHPALGNKYTERANTSPPPQRDNLIETAQASKWSSSQSLPLGSPWNKNSFYRQFTFLDAMVEQQPYIDPVLSRSDVPSDRTSNLSDCAQCSASSYSDLTTYPAVSPFTIQASHATDILTPMSVADSPPLHQTHKFMISKVMGHYSGPDSPSDMSPIPRNGPKIYASWDSSHFEMQSHDSEAGSPMNTPGPGLGEADYYAPHRHTTISPDLYAGGYALSDSPHGVPASVAASHVEASYYTLAVHGPSPHQFGAGHGIPMRIQPRESNRDVMMPAPMLRDGPRESPYRVSDGRRGSHDASTKQEDPSPKMTGPWTDGPRKRSRVEGDETVKKSSRKKKSKQAPHSQAVDDEKDCYNEATPPLLQEGCPDKEKFIHKSYWEHRHSHGKDLWARIQRDFMEKFGRDPKDGKEPSLAMLQMAWTRGRKYYRWKPRDEELLRQAVVKASWEKFYDLVLKEFIDMGGSRNMHLSATDVQEKCQEDGFKTWFEEQNIDLGKITRKPPSARKDADAATP